MPDQPVSLAAALATLQADLPRIPKSGRAQVQNRETSYAPYDKILAKIRPILRAHEFLWSSRPTLIGDQFVLSYELIYLPTGERLSGDYPLAKGPAQQQGSQISYAKRYALVAVLDLEVVGEDDDGMQRTPAKIPGPDHERLRYGMVEGTPDDRPAERSRGPVDNGPVDKWTDQPTGNFDIGSPEDRPGSIDPRGAQMRNLQRAFNEAGIKDRSVRLGMVSDMIGREIMTANQLSQVEADHVIRRLRESRQADG